MIDELTGAWMHQENNQQQLLQFIDGYHTHTIYSKEEKKFIETRGGPYSITNRVFTLTIEFDTTNQDQIGRTAAYSFLIKDNELTIHRNGQEIIHKKIDNGSAPLSGAWHITSQMREGIIVPIHRTGTRKTVKVLSATRFQWTAIDPGNKEFFGTGGGTYQFENGKYTEQIDFFSKDSNRVGASLSFEGKLENGDWHHSGTSTKGEKIYEIWSKVNR